MAYGGYRTMDIFRFSLLSHRMGDIFSWLKQMTTSNSHAEFNIKFN